MSEAYQWVNLLASQIVFVDVDRVNLDDLVHAVPWTIVRCMGDPNQSVKIHVSQDDQFLGCVGGMISEDA